MDNIYKTVMSFSDFGKAILDMEYDDIPKYVFDYADSEKHRSKLQTAVKLLIKIKDWEQAKKEKIVSEETAEIFINDFWDEIAKTLN